MPQGIGTYGSQVGRPKKKKKKKNTKIGETLGNILKRRY